MNYKGMNMSTMKWWKSINRGVVKGELYHLFYKGKKIISKNLYFWLTWEALAHWVYNKSNFTAKYCLSYQEGREGSTWCNRNKAYGLYINVKACSIKDIVLLMNILMIRHRLSCSLDLNKSHIYIKNKSMPLLLADIRPFISSFRGRRPFNYICKALSLPNQLYKG